MIKPNTTPSKVYDDGTVKTFVSPRGAAREISQWVKRALLEACKRAGKKLVGDLRKQLRASRGKTRDKFTYSVRPMGKTFVLLRIVQNSWAARVRLKYEKRQNSPVTDLWVMNIGSYEQAIVEREAAQQILDTRKIFIDGKSV